MSKLVLILWCGLIALVGACQLEPKQSDQLSVSVDDSVELFADNSSKTKVKVTLDGNVSPGKVLTASTSLGILDRAAASGQGRTKTLTTGSANELTFTLYAERTAGKGVITVTGPGGLTSAADFEIKQVNDNLTLGGEASGTPDGKTSVALTLDLSSEDKEPREVTLKTNLGVLSPEKAGEAARLRVIKVMAGEQVAFKLYAPSTAGSAVVTAELGKELDSWVVDFKAFSEPVLELGPDTTGVADGKSSVKLNLELRSPNPEAQNVTLKTNIGVLSPEKSGEAARVRSIRMKPGTTSFELYAPNVAGTAVVTAELDTALDTQVVTFNPTGERSAFLMAPNAVADGSSTVPVTVSYTGATADEIGSLTLSTTLGVLSPAATGEAQRQAQLMLKSGSPHVAHLQVGNIAGQAILTLGGPAVPTTTYVVGLTRAEPTSLYLSLVDGSVLDNSRNQLSVAAQLQRATGNVSRGTSIGFMACCDTGSGLQECTELVSVPPVQSDDDGNARESVLVVLTPAGRTFVGQKGTPPTDDVKLALYGFVPQVGSPPTCAALASGTADTGPGDNLSLVLRKAPP